VYHGIGSGAEKSYLRDIYVIGSTNSGKSTLINAFIKRGYLQTSTDEAHRKDDAAIVHNTQQYLAPEHALATPKSQSSTKQHAQAQSEHLLAKVIETVSLTTSRMPGTTLGLVSFRMHTKHGRMTLHDTPGVVNPLQLSSRMTFDELRCVLPR